MRSLSLHNVIDVIRLCYQTFQSNLLYRLVVECAQNERKYMKIYASYEDKTLNEFVMDCVRFKLYEKEQAHIPNDETIASLEESARGEKIKKFTSMDELFQDLGIQCKYSSTQIN